MTTTTSSRVNSSKPPRSIRSKSRLFPKVSCCFHIYFSIDQRILFSFPPIDKYSIGLYFKSWLLNDDNESEHLHLHIPTNINDQTDNNNTTTSKFVCLLFFSSNARVGDNIIKENVHFFHGHISSSARFFLFIGA
jgi:hypothetical protein